MKKLLFILSLQIIHASELVKHLDIQQLLIVTVQDKDQNQAWLHSYEKSGTQSSEWKKVFEPIKVSLGRNGLGLGSGVHDQTFVNHGDLSKKQEGDGRSPAGIFKLSSLFGYSKKPLTNKMPYIHLASDIHCVDDSQSPQYNRIIQKSTGYQSFELMRRKDNLYKWGIVVDHNIKAEPKAGSCIFIHIATKDYAPTAGCTAMKESDLIKIIKWLDMSKNPTLLQYYFHD